MATVQIHPCKYFRWSQNRNFIIRLYIIIFIKKITLGCWLFDEVKSRGCTAPAKLLSWRIYSPVKQTYAGNYKLYLFRG
jgi:hypothetical protein